MSLCVTVSISPLGREAFLPDPGGAGSEQRSSCSSAEVVLCPGPHQQDAVIPGHAPQAQFREEREAQARDHLSEAWRPPCSGSFAWLAYLRVGF